MSATGLEYIQGPGYRIYRELLAQKTCEFVFNNVSVEVLFYVFNDVLSPQEVCHLIDTYGINTTRLICDSKWRKEIGIPTGLESRVLKASGKTSLYTSAYIRDNIKRNRDVFNAVASIYGTNKLAYTNGLEHFIYKPFMSEESVAILDCKILEPLEDMTGSVNPFHYTAYVCVSSPNSGDNQHSPDEQNELIAGNVGNEQNDASLSLLENFDFHFNTIRSMIIPGGKFPIDKQKKLGSISLLENLNVKAINAELLKIHNSKIHRSQINKNQINKSEINGSREPAGTFRELRWKNIKMKAGDVIVFDCRIPYMTFKNRFDIPSMYVPVSLRQVGPNWFGSKNHAKLVDSVTRGKVGDWSKRKLKACNIDEYSFRSSVSSKLGSLSNNLFVQTSNEYKSTDTISNGTNVATDNAKKQVANWFSMVQSLEQCTDVSSFTDNDKRIFGLLKH